MWWHTVTHERGSEGETGEWSGWPVLFTLPRNMVYPALLPLIRTPRLPAVEWTDARTDSNGFVRFAERRNLVSARVPSHFKRSLPTYDTKAVNTAGALTNNLWRNKKCSNNWWHLKVSQWHCCDRMHCAQTGR